MSDPKRYQRVQAVFDAARAVHGAERAALLEAACAGDDALRHEVEALLAEHEGATGDFLSDERIADARRRLDRLARPGPIDLPEQFGPYRIVRQIGAGGMGVVWEATQDRPARRVAIKVIRPGLAVAEVISRFEAERQALALMDHPNIARVYGAGETDRGLPYFVMEFVDGEPVTDYCERCALSVADRLALVQQICSAVHHAHQRGVIHRDLKPANVLVTEVDGAPSARVIDFGVAKATQAPLTERTLFTEQGQLIGTPEYMSPEQAGPEANDVDVRTDVYALGVLLYELLVGLPPFEPDSLRAAGFAEMMRVIRDVEPPRPSTRVSGLATLPGIAARRGLEPRRLRTMLRGELDWVVMKCLEKDRERRYGSASDLAGDIERYLTRLPVTAGPPSRVYRLRKLVHRHRLATALLSVTTLAVVLGIAGITGGLFWALDERDRAEAAAEQARWDAYVSNLAACSASLALHDCGTARQRLELCPVEMRGWEWFRLEAALDDAEFVLRGHAARVWSIAISTDGTRIATGSHDSTVRVWDAATGTQIAMVNDHSGTICGLAINADGTLVASIDWSGRLLVWRAETGAIVQRIETTLAPIWNLTFIHDDTRVCGTPATSSVTTWDIASGTEVSRVADVRTQSPIAGGVVVREDAERRLVLHDLETDHVTPLGAAPRERYDFVLSADRSHVAVLDDEFGLRVWRTRDGALQLNVPADQAEPPLALSDTGRTIAYGVGAGAVRLVDLETGAEETMRGHALPPLFVAFADEGRRAWTVGRDRTVRVWNCADGTQRAVFHGHEQTIPRFAVAPDGTWLCTGAHDNTARIWRLEHADRRPYIAIPDDGGRIPVELSASGRTLLIGAEGRGVQLVRCADNHVLRTYPRGTWMQPDCLETDGVRLEATIDGPVRVLDARTDVELGVLVGHDRRVVTARISADGTCFATGSEDGTVRLWDATTFAERFVLEGHEDQINHVDFAPDGTSLITRADTGRVWDTATGALRFAFSAAKGTPVYGALYSPDSTSIVAWPFGQPPTVYDARTGAIRYAITDHDAPVISAAFDRTGAQLGTASQDRTAHLYDAATGALIRVFTGHDADVNSIAFHPDGSRVVTASYDDTVRIWDPLTGRLCSILSDHGSAVGSADFSRDGTRLITASKDGSARVWDIMPYRERFAETGAGAGTGAGDR